MTIRAWLPMLALLATAPAAADPCGMVPPIRISDAGQPAIQREGPQRTYVMFHEGVETMALRPGFTGKIDDFGMLIPFPSVPALRKIDDATFAHIEAAIDPPEVDVYLYDPRMMYEEMDMAMADDEGGAAPPQEEEALGYYDVNVVKQEAVGMYQVAVLEAGSPVALQRWMDDNGYRYPDGMDATVKDYVQAKWCFVAIKATVGQAPGVAPKPGMRHTVKKLPTGSEFDGHVQGMGFRFRTDSPVIPMRLSVFNPDSSGDGPRNVVYMLTEGGVKLSDIGEQTVVAQIPGKQLTANLTAPLKVNWHSGSAKDMEPNYNNQLQPMRDPTPHNGVAKGLFASDLHAIGEGELSLPFEEEEKELLRISEAFGLRGTEIDALHATELNTQRDELVSQALSGLNSLTLTVVDGQLPVEVLARQNLSFEPYTLKDAIPRSDTLTPANLSMSAPIKTGR